MINSVPNSVKRLYVFIDLYKAFQLLKYLKSGFISVYRCLQVYCACFARDLRVNTKTTGFTCICNSGKSGSVAIRSGPLVNKHSTFYITQKTEFILSFVYNLVICAEFRPLASRGNLWHCNRIAHHYDIQRQYRNDDRKK